MVKLNTSDCSESWMQYCSKSCCYASCQRTVWSCSVTQLCCRLCIIISVQVCRRACSCCCLQDMRWALTLPLPCGNWRWTPTAWLKRCDGPPLMQACCFHAVSHQHPPVQCAEVVLLNSKLKLLHTCCNDVCGRITASLNV